MAKKQHSKKRNTALLYRFLVRKMSSALVEGDEQLANRALKILKTSFRPGTELHKELRLINALYQVTVSNPNTASSVLGEAKGAVRTHDYQKLDREKSLLIRNINLTLDDPTFYEQHVPEYRMLATIQTLVNEWRRPTGDIETVARYEDVLHSHLLMTKPPVSDGGLVEGTSVDSRLIVKAMTKRLNEKYSGSLSTFQREILRLYALTGENQVVASRLASLRDELSSLIETYVGSNTNDINTCKNLIEVRAKLLSEDMSSVTDDTITRFMAYSRLLDELKNDVEVTK